MKKTILLYYLSLSLSDISSVHYFLSFVISLSLSFQSIRLPLLLASVVVSVTVDHDDDDADDNVKRLPLSLFVSMIK